MRTHKGAQVVVADHLDTLILDELFEFGIHEGVVIGHPAGPIGVMARSSGVSMDGWNRKCVTPAGKFG